MRTKLDESALSAQLNRVDDALRELIAKNASWQTLADFLDGLVESMRTQAIRGLRAKDLAKLYLLAEAVNHRHPASLEFLVPATVPPDHTVEWVGKNSLPVFRFFTKRFIRSSPSALVGHNTGAAQRLVGPGYFMAVIRPDKATEMLFDYTLFPAQSPPGWPPVQDNKAGLARWVFANMHDYFRPIGAHVGIGAAYTDHGKFKGQYFALARGPTLALGA